MLQGMNNATYLDQGRLHWRGLGEAAVHCHPARDMLHHGISQDVKVDQMPADLIAMIDTLTAIDARGVYLPGAQRFLQQACAPPRPRRESASSPRRPAHLI